MYRVDYARLVAAVFLLLFSSLANVMAQPPHIPGPADAGRMEDRFDSRKPIAPSPAVPDSAITPSQPPPVNVPPDADKIHFVLKQLRIEGVTVYSQERLSAFYQDKIGKNISLSDIYRITENITRLYNKDGYVLSRAIIPPQQIKNGIVTIAIIEGSIGEVHTQGAYHETALTRAVIAHIESMHPLNANEFERDVLLLNDLGGVTVKAVMEPVSANNASPGTVAARLIFDDKPGNYSATIDNYGSRYLGPEEVSLSTTKSGIINPYDQIALSGIGSMPFSELRYMSGQYVLPLTSTGISLALSGGYGTADPGYRLKQDDIQNHSATGSALLGWEAIRQRAENLTFSGGVTVKNIKSEILGTPLYDDNLRELQASASYTKTDRYKGTNAINTQLVKGFQLFGASQPGTLNLSRGKGQSDFTKLDVTATRLQDVGSAWQIYAAASGQMSNRVLLTSEEFGYGGQVFGRAYDTSEIIGDQGLAGALELRYNGLPSWGEITTQPFTFYDIGKVWSKDNIGQDRSGASAGLGMRFATDYHISGTFTLAQPLTRDVAANAPNHGKDTRGFFSLSCQY